MTKIKEDMYEQIYCKKTHYCVDGNINNYCIIIINCIYFCIMLGCEKENKKYGLFVGEDVNKMKLELGAPTEDIINSTGNEVLIYKTKKYGMPCERRFEVNASGTIIAFSSSGCF